MPANIDGRERVKEKEIQESALSDLTLIGLADLSESEIKWVKLHQMFDK